MLEQRINEFRRCESKIKVKLVGLNNNFNSDSLIVFISCPFGNQKLRSSILIIKTKLRLKANLLESKSESPASFASSHHSESLLSLMQVCVINPLRHPLHTQLKRAT